MVVLTMSVETIVVRGKRLERSLVAGLGRVTRISRVTRMLLPH
jgi:hypothetical protein